MMAAVHRYGGYVAQSTGDGIFALFGAPVALLSFQLYKPSDTDVSDACLGPAYSPYNRSRSA
jgi:class 3 adenylate cyclase